MLYEMLKDKVKVADHISDWKYGIEAASQPLLEDSYITAEYVEAMKTSVIENGPYMVVMPGVAIPHARPENGVMRTGISLLFMKDGVSFPGDNQIQLMIVLAAEDAEQHLELISELTDVLMDDDAMEKLFHAQSKEEIIECFS